MKTTARIRRKLRSRSGMTMVELLVALLISLLVFMLAAAGIGVGANIYRSSVLLAESEVLSATLNTTISDMLRYASKVTCDVDGTDPTLLVSFDSSYYSTSRESLSIVLSDEGKLQCQYKDKYDGTEIRVDLCPGGAYTNGMKVSDLKITYNSTSNVFSGSYKIIAEGSTFTRDVEFTYRALIIKTGA